MEGEGERETTGRRHRGDERATDGGEVSEEREGERPPEEYAPEKGCRYYSWITSLVSATILPKPPLE